MAASALFSNAIIPPSSLFCRTRFPVPSLNSSSVEIWPFSGSSSKKLDPNKRLKMTQLRAVAAESVQVRPPLEGKKKVKVLVAGKRKGFEVMVFERDLSAVRGEGEFRGPIQIQSNASGALEAIDMGVAEEVMEAGLLTGDRINGLVDGSSGSWYVKFDTFTPAAERGLPITRLINRMTVQQILARAIGEDVIMNESNVVNFEDNGDKVTVMLENGQQFEGDFLVGADGIRSKVRKKLFGQTDPTYSGYTCHTGVVDFVPVDIESVGYRVFLGYKQFFVSSDIGSGKIQWYAYHNEAPGGVDSPNCKKARLLKIFEGWCDNVIDLIQATDEEAILRRDVYDRAPSFTWGKGRVTLLGDRIHAMQPNLGQGGCMAIEDAHKLAVELEKAWNISVKSGYPIDIVSSLRRYERGRLFRVSMVHGMAGMATILASTYKPYLGVGLGPLSFLTKFRIRHPGTFGWRYFMDLSMPLVLNWLLGGYSSTLEGRPLACRLSDKANEQLHRWYRDDDALERALCGEWFLLPCGKNTFRSIHLRKDENTSCFVRSASQPGVSIVLSSPEVSTMHARITYKDRPFYVIDLNSKHGTFITDNVGRRRRVPPNYPTRFHPSNAISFGSNEKVKFRVKVMRSAPNNVENKGSRILQAV